MASKELYARVINDLINHGHLDAGKFISRIGDSIRDHKFDKLRLSSVHGKYSYTTRVLVVDIMTEKRLELIKKITYDEIDLVNDPVDRNFLKSLTCPIISICLKDESFEVDREYKEISTDGNVELTVNYPKMQIINYGYGIKFSAGTVDHLESLYLISFNHNLETNITIDTVTLGSNIVFGRMIYDGNSLENLIKFLKTSNVKNLIVDGYFETEAEDDKMLLEKSFPNVIYSRDH